MADAAGFSVDDALVGASAELWRDVEFVVTAQLAEIERDVRGVVADAQLAYQPFEALALTLGTMVPPFSRSALTYSQNLSTVERPYVADLLRPGRRLGVMLDGRPWGGQLTYMVALMNGTAGYVDGNEDGGFMAGARLEASVLGDPDPNDAGDPGLSIAVSTYHAANTVERERGFLLTCSSWWIGSVWWWRFCTRLSVLTRCTLGRPAPMQRRAALSTWLRIAVCS